METRIGPQDRFDLFAADMAGDTPTLDLHGMRRDEALSDLRYFLKSCRTQGHHAVRIVHGRGDGILRSAVHAHLNEELGRGRIRAYRDSDAPHQAGAVTLALFPQDPQEVRHAT